MRRWQIVGACLVAIAVGPGFRANAIGGGGTKGGGVKVTPSGDKRSARADTGKPGAITEYPRVPGCHTWTVPGVAAVGDAVAVPAQKWRWCEGYRVGALCIPPGLTVQKWCFRVADGTPDGVETAVIRPETPEFSDHGFWFTQRIGYVWIDPVFAATRTIRMSGDPGEADLVLVRAVFDPGILTSDGKMAKTCTAEEITTPYDASRGHIDQDGCSFIYFKSSSNEPGGRYQTKVRLVWKVTRIKFDSGAENNAPNLELESDTAGRSVLVEEIQSLVPCKSITANGCG